MAKHKKKRSPAVRRIRWIFGSIFRVIASIFMVCVITGCIVGCVLTVYILDYIGTIEDIDIKNIDMNYTSIIYANDENGEPFELSRIHGDENRIQIDRDEMPDYLFDVVVAAEDNGLSAYEAILDLQPDIVLIDIQMRGMNGLDVIEKVRAVDGPQPVFIIIS